MELFLDRTGCLRRFGAEGHATGAARGGNIACAAATVLMRTTARLLDGIEEIPTRGSAEREGHLDLRVEAVPEERRGWLRGVTDSLLQGLADLEREHPDLIALRIHDFEE